MSSVQRGARLRRSPFFEATQRWGAQGYTVYNHMLFPTRFADYEDEYWSLVRDVTLWAFTTDFFSSRPDELAEFETAMAYMDQPVPAYLAQLAVIQQHDTTGRLAGIAVPTLVLAGEQDILIPVSLSKELHKGIAGAEHPDLKSVLAAYSPAELVARAAALKDNNYVARRDALPAAEVIKNSNMTPITKPQ